MRRYPERLRPVEGGEQRDPRWRDERYRPEPHQPFSPRQQQRQRAAGPPSPRRGRGDKVTPNASVLFSKGQLFVVVVVLAAVAFGFYRRPERTAVALVAACIGFYVATAALKLVITIAGNRHRPPPQFRMRPGEPTLPPYAVLLPVHKEANMLSHLVDRVDKLMYPRHKLCALILIEADDHETLEAARRLRIPFVSAPRGAVPGDHIRILVIPPGGPKTKPNALNVAMNVVIRDGCEFVTIYDAEDRPEADQLLKAVGTFRAGPPELACLQAELAFWNDDTNWVTALYWIGYKIHFTRFLPGLARLGLPIPLGGTSNHFRVNALMDVALQPGGEVWDPNNLTEDADLGARLAAGGYRVDLLRSMTMEEAPVKIGVVDKQQRRWKAGYLQTGLVHTRHPLRAMRRMGPIRWFCFNLLVLGVPVAFMLNPLSMLLTVAYFVTRAASIEALFPTAIYYPAIAVMVLGNFTVLYELIQTCLKEASHSRGRFGLLRYMLLAQFMWLWMSRSTYIAVWEMLIGKRTWHKTPHGHAEEPAEAGLSAPAPRRPTPAWGPGGRPHAEVPMRPVAQWQPDPSWRRAPGQREQW